MNRRSSVHTIGTSLDKFDHAPAKYSFERSLLEREKQNQNLSGTHSVDTYFINNRIIFNWTESGTQANREWTELIV